MSLTLSDVNKKVRFIDQAEHGKGVGLLLAISTDHKIAFVEWGHDGELYALRKRGSVPAERLEVVEPTDSNGTEIVGGGFGDR